MRPVYISIDVEPDLHAGSYNSLEALPKLIPLFKKYKVKATFFVTCDCLKKNLRLFNKLKNIGHEIALHGYDHRRVDNLSFVEKEMNISKSLECFKKYLKIKPKGFRGPEHSIDTETIEILKKNNFKYDSSLTPWNFYHFLVFWKIYIPFSHNFAHLKIHKRKGLWEIALTSFILPFSSVTIRVLPKFLLNLYFSFILLFKHPVFLMHSWDLIEMPKSKIYRFCPLNKFLKKFEYMLDFFSNRREFKKIKDIHLN